MIEWEQSEGEDGAERALAAIEHSDTNYGAQVRISVKTIMFFLNCCGTLREVAVSVNKHGVYIGTGWRVSLAVPPTAKEDGWFDSLVPSSVSEVH